MPSTHTYTHTMCAYDLCISEMQKGLYLNVSAPISAVRLCAEMYFIFSRSNMGGHWECVLASRHNYNQPCQRPACSADPSPWLAMWSRRPMTSEHSDFRTNWTTVWLKPCRRKLLPGDSEMLSGFIVRWLPRQSVGEFSLAWGRGDLFAPISLVTDCRRPINLWEEVLVGVLYLWQITQDDQLLRKKTLFECIVVDGSMQGWLGLMLLDMGRDSWSGEGTGEE